MNRPWHIFQI